MLTKTQVWLGIAVNVAVFSTVNWLWLSGDRPAQTSFLQTLVLADTLLILWLYTRATYRLASTAEDQVKTMKAQFFDQKIQELIKRKPIVFMERTPGGGFQVSNVGNAYTANVWYSASSGDTPVPLGALGRGESRFVSISVADRHLLIAESTPTSQRRWTPTMNVLDGTMFCHGFIQRMDDAHLKFRGPINEFLRPYLFEKLMRWNPRTDPPWD